MVAMHLTMNKHRITLFAGLLSFLTLGTACHPSGEPEDRSSDNGSDILEGSDDIVLPDASYYCDHGLALGGVVAAVYGDTVAYGGIRTRVGWTATEATAR